MSRPEIRSYDYVNQPYATVRTALIGNPVAIFRSATRSAADRAQSLAAELRVSVGGVDLTAEVAVNVGAISDQANGPSGSPATRIPIRWQAAHHPNFFPVMSAVLSIYPLTATETQLEFYGEYEPPLGIVGGAVDAVILHRVAEASVHRFVSDVAHHLRERLSHP